MKRKNYIDWHTYFMGIAVISSKRSKDPNTQVGACIVNKEKRIVGTGYNGFPRGCSDDEFPWEKSDNFLESKYTYVCHAEINAILNSTYNLNGATLYTTLYPCNECAKAIIQSGIKKIIFKDGDPESLDIFKAATKLFKAAEIKVFRYNKNINIKNEGEV